MQTLLLGKEQISAYLNDLRLRLLSLGEGAPAVWVPLGYSGAALLAELFRTATELNTQNTVVVAANCRRDPPSRNMEILWDEDESSAPPAGKFVGKNVLVIDSAVHSGTTMATVVETIWQAGAAGVCSYTLVLKESSRFVPNYWAVSIGDEDRAFFLLDAIPNNRFVRPGECAEGDETVDPFGNALVDAKPKRFPYFTVRRLSREDINKDKFKVSVESLNRSTWADLYYMMQNSDASWTYVLETQGKIVAYLSLEFPDERELSIEQVAVDPSFENKGYAAGLLRWAETLARLKDCDHIRLWAIAEEQSWYQRMGFRHVPSQALDLGSGEKYVRMRKCLLPHKGCCPHADPPASPPPAPTVPKTG